ncbi:T9SS type A sorting domain-containing protein [Empedobacter brevis]
MSKNLLFISLFSVIFYKTFAQEASVEFSILDINAKESANINSITSYENDIVFIAERISSEPNLFKYNDKDGVKELLEYNAFGRLRSWNSIIKLDENKLFFLTEKNNTSYLNVLNIKNKEVKEVSSLFSYNDEYALFDNKLFYLGYESKNSSKKRMYVTDGTKNGTKVLETSNLSEIKNLKHINGELLFTAEENGLVQIFRINKDLNLERLSNFNTHFTGYDGITSYNNSYYMLVNSYPYFPEIKKCTDGTCETFLKYKKHNNSIFESFVYNNRLYFGYTSGDSYNDFNELYSTDGTAEGLKKVETGNQNVYLQDGRIKYINFKNNIYLIAQQNVGGQYQNSFFKLENNALTKLYTLSNVYSNLYSSENNIYFLGNNTSDYNNTKLIKSDGTISGTSIADETKIYSSSLGIIKNHVYYQKYEELNGGELWSYDENLNTNKFVRNINYANSGEVIDMTPVGNRVYFAGNSNKSYSVSGNENDIINHPIALENTNYSTQSYVGSGEDVISISSNSSSQYYMSILNKDNNKFELITNNNLGLINASLIQTIGDKIYFVSSLYSDPSQNYNLQLNYYDKKTKEIGAVKDINNQFIEVLSVGNYTGLFEMNGSYYYATYGRNKSTLLKLNPVNNTISIGYQFTTGYDANQSTIVGKYKDKIVVEYDGKLHLFDGQKMSELSEGLGLKVNYPKEINPNNFAAVNNRFLVLKPGENYYTYRVYGTDGVNEEYLGLQSQEKVHALEKCNEKLYFVTSNNNLFETDGTTKGTKFIDKMDHSYNLFYSPMKCYKNNLFYVGNYYGSTINVINGNENKSFDIKFKELTDIRLDYDILYDLEIINDKVFVNMSHHDAGKEVFVVDYKDFNLTNLSTNDNIYNDKVEKIIVYPNPFNNKLFIKGNENEVLKELKLYDLTGKLILVKQVNKQEIEFSTELLKKGIYFLQIITNNHKNYTKKLIKN